MSYQERRALVSIATTIVISAFYFVYVLQRYPDADAYSPEVFRFWGTTIVILIPVSIVAQIIIYIVFSILNTVVTREDEPAVTDERDKLIGLKSARNSLYVFTIGFLLAMLTLVAELPPTVMFVVLISAGIASEVVNDISEFVFYRRGF